MSVSTNTSATFFAMTNWFEVVVKCRLASPKIANFAWDDLPLADIGEAFPSFPRAGAWAGRARGAMGYWSALCAYLLVAIAKRQKHLDPSKYEVLQVVSVSSLEQIPLNELFVKLDTRDPGVDIPKQLEINYS